MPAGLKKQVPAKEQKRFVIHRGFEKHLVMYTRKEWDRIVAEVNDLSLFVRKHRELAVSFTAVRRSWKWTVRAVCCCRRG